MTTKKKQERQQGEVPRIIIFEKFRSPFGEEDEIDDINAKIMRDMQSDGSDDYLDYGEDDELIEDAAEIAASKPSRVKAVVTPMGIVPISDHTDITKLFDMWTVHTNFVITESIKKIVDTCPGIETLDIYTPYRWRISIGKAFDSVQVKQDLMRRLDVRTQSGAVNKYLSES